MNARSTLRLACACVAFLGVASNAEAGIVVFDVPAGAGTKTSAFAISNNGLIVGQYVDPQNATRGFERAVNGNIVFPIQAPGDNSNFTRALGVNGAGTIVGDYENTSGNTSTFHGYFLNGATFTQYDVGGPVSTSIFGINDKGDFVGTFGSTVQPNQGFVNIGGLLTTFSFAGASSLFGIGINKSDQVVGEYFDASGAGHGYVRQANGTISPIDVPGATLTAALGINDAGVIVGGYIAKGVAHGFIDIGGVFSTFDAPGATSTIVYGINNSDMIDGTLKDANGTHAFLASVPEPSAFILLGVGVGPLLALAALRRRFKRKA